jgi:hypothetical protein
LWVGDMNADPGRAKSPNYKKFIQLCSEDKLEVCKKLLPNSTFHHFNGHSSSRIDLVVQPCDQPCMVTSTAIDTRNPMNNSCHDPIIIDLNVAFTQQATANQDNVKKSGKTRTPAKIPWEKMDLVAYKYLTGQRLET